MVNDTSPPQRMSKAEIESQAVALLEKHGLLRVPVDPIKLAKKLDIRIFNAKFNDESISGMLARRGPSLTMLVNASDAAHRKRFTIAHELGHYFLKHFGTRDSDHTDHESDLFRTETSSDLADHKDIEVQANQFAAALLMPAPLVKEAWRHTRDIDRLARYFNVSSDAMGYRLNSLRLR